MSPPSDRRARKPEPPEEAATAKAHAPRHLMPLSNPKHVSHSEERQARYLAACTRIEQRRGELGILGDRCSWLSTHEHWLLRQLRWRRSA